MCEAVLEYQTHMALILVLLCKCKGAKAARWLLVSMAHTGAHTASVPHMHVSDSKTTMKERISRLRKPSRTAESSGK